MARLPTFQRRVPELRYDTHLESEPRVLTVSTSHAIVKVDVFIAEVENNLAVLEEKIISGLLSHETSAK